MPGPIPKSWVAVSFTLSLMFLVLGLKAWALVQQFKSSSLNETLPWLGKRWRHHDGPRG